MIIQTIFISFFIYIFSTIFSKKPTYLIITPLILSYMLGGMLNDKYSIFGRLPHELILTFTFLLLHIKAIVNHNNKYLSLTWGDKIFFLYYFLLYLIPWAFNIYDYVLDNNIFLVRQFLPIKIWIIYRIFYYFQVETKVSNSNQLSKILDLVLKAYVIGMIFSGFVGMFRMINIPILTEFIEDTWPFVSELKGNFFRMQGTVGGINGGGVLFAFSAIFSLYLFFARNKKIFLYLFPLLVLFLLLSASFSSTLTFVFIFGFMFIKNPTFSLNKVINILLISVLMFSMLLINSNIRETFVNTVNYRMEQQLGEKHYSINTKYQLLPNSFISRLLLWEKYAEYIKRKPFWGYGYRVTKKPIYGTYARASISESYFIETLLYSGIIGFVSFLLIYFNLIITAARIYNFKKEKNLIIAILWGILISQISNMTMMYGGITELFGILIFFIESYRLADFCKVLPRC